MICYIYIEESGILSSIIMVNILSPGGAGVAAMVADFQNCGGQIRTPIQDGLLHLSFGIAGEDKGCAAVGDFQNDG